MAPASWLTGLTSRMHAARITSLPISTLIIQQVGSAVYQICARKHAVHIVVPKHTVCIGVFAANMSFCDTHGDGTFVM